MDAHRAEGSPVAKLAEFKQNVSTVRFPFPLFPLGHQGGLVRFEGLLLLAMAVLHSGVVVYC